MYMCMCTHCMNVCMACDQFVYVYVCVYSARVYVHVCVLYVACGKFLQCASVHVHVKPVYINNINKY
jgi:hypothetical protein